jgi:hypothetical protein
MANELLKSCPTCRRPHEGGDFGLRDYEWVSGALPGRISPTDLDFVLERSGRVLIHEYKDRGAIVRMGQRLTLRTFVRMGCDVWLVTDGAKAGTYDVGILTRDGTVDFTERAVPLTRLRARVVEWLERVDDERERAL